MYSCTPCPSPSCLFRNSVSRWHDLTQVQPTPICSTLRFIQRSMAHGASRSSAPCAVTTGQSGEFVSREVAGDNIDFSVGQPSPSLLPLHNVFLAAQSRLEPTTNSALLLQYGPRQGYPSFRAAVADFLSQRYGGQSVSPDSLMTCSGVSHGLDLACRSLSLPGDVILVEAPTYFLAKGIFTSARLQQRPMPTDKYGIDTEALHRLLEECDAAGTPKPRLLYTIPVHNNPTGTTLPPERRRQLVQLAHQHGLFIIADEVYQMLTFPGAPEPPPPLRHFEQEYLAQTGATSNTTAGHAQAAAAAPSILAPSSSASMSMDLNNAFGTGLPRPSVPAGASRVVSCASFSKILAPGLRLGWVEAGPEVMELLRADGVISSGGCVASLPAGVAHSALQLGLVQAHLDGVVRPALAARCQALCEALQHHLPGCLFHVPQGGYFVWLNLPSKVGDARQLLAHAEAAGLGLRFTPGEACGGLPGTARLCFAFYSPRELQEGVRRLAAAVHTFPGGSS